MYSLDRIVTKRKGVGVMRKAKYREGPVRILFKEGDPVRITTYKGHPETVVTAVEFGGKKVWLSDYEGSFSDTALELIIPKTEEE